MNFDRGIFDKEIETCKQMTKKANNIYGDVSFIETDEGYRTMTMGVTHP